MLAAAPRAVKLHGAQVRCKRRACTKRKPCPECALSAPRNEPSCSEIEVTIRDFESGLGVFADDGAFAFGSRRDIELGARILYDHCVMWGMMPHWHTAGKTVAMYFGQPVLVHLREFLPDDAIPPIEMGGGEAPVVPAGSSSTCESVQC